MATARWRARHPDSHPGPILTETGTLMHFGQIWQLACWAGWLKSGEFGCGCCPRNRGKSQSTYQKGWRG
jgi:hypothetical protein